ncbi:class I SAM-dependent DNA methyltransferase [Paraburkholderia gardini]|uniref:2-methoxy-6-polyprenyl-1,4-benzoquinol methylase, mitochondrial n=1 Tax=Paraburkholderia gardini TaxID=2823469 RepID=A0ABN7QKF7_9BURK|nr:class I SAM-dependent methyltransferase [Paraburkholderia gardini]CAG4886496.1 2-methoxy-6-polyprenyl-1,4-benzoquinol methylase, mitochondrial [Paraburkholderia gardini]
MTLYSDPRLVDLYDALNPAAADTAFYLHLAQSLDAARVLDIGCGTGLLTCALADRGHDVTGVDPSAAMLAVARSRAGGEQVRWLEGDAHAARSVDADLALMTGHVAQVFVDDTSWRQTLSAAYDALRPGGCLAFESRNPACEPWRAWTPEASRRCIESQKYGRVDVWHRVVDVTGERVRFATHYRFERDDEEIVAESELRFRSQTALESTLREAGFVSMNWYGGWSREPVDAASRELVVVAMRD